MPDDTTDYLRKNPSHLAVSVQAADRVPEYLRNSLTMVRSAFPDGLPLAQYSPLLCLFRESGWSFRGIAEAMHTCFDIDYHRALNDAYATDDALLPLDEIERLRQHLLPHGFEAWHAEQRHV